MARWLLRWTESGRMAGLNLLTWLTAYLDECGRNGAEPLAGPALERFLHWNASPDDLQVWAQPPPAGKTRTNNIAAGTATANRHAGHQHALSQDFRILTPIWTKSTFRD